MIREEQKKEALVRLKTYFNLKSLEASFHPIKRFEKEDTIFFQEKQSSFFDGILWECNNNTCNGVVDRAIKKFNEKHPNYLVYYALLNGEYVSIFFVSDNKNEWALDNRDLLDHTPFVYVENILEDDMSEFGCIGIKKSYCGGIVREY